MHEIHEISWNPRKSMKIDETAASWDRVKVSLGPSFRLQRPAEAANLWPLKSWNLMKSHEILRNTYKSMKMHEIHEISWNPRKSMKIDEKATSWNRVKVSLRASFRLQRLTNFLPLKTWKSTKSRKSLEIWAVQKSVSPVELEKCYFSSKSLDHKEYLTELAQPASQPASQPAHRAIFFANSEIQQSPKSPNFGILRILRILES